MKSIDRLLVLLLSLAVLTAGTGIALGDWDPADGHKMHWPQLPDPNGWDVRISDGFDPQGLPQQWIVADDWLCTESGPVADVHFWVSWLGDRESNISRVHLSVHGDVPAGPNNEFSHPELVALWERDFLPGEFTIRPYGNGDQGWYDPLLPEIIPSDHSMFYQVNVMDIVDPFVQKRDTIYWLDISVDVAGDPPGTFQLGWKTSGSQHFQDDAVYWSYELGRWMELRDPRTQESLDMAFVVNVPEPGTICLIGLGAVGMLFVARRKGDWTFLRR